MLGLFLGKDEEKHYKTYTLRGTQHAKLFLLKEKERVLGRTL